MRQVVVLRPQPGADTTARRLTAAGLTPVVAPLFETVACGWDAPDPATIDALLVTSAATARLGGAGLASFAHLPTVAVGAQTAAALRAVGFTRVEDGGGDLAAAVAQLSARRPARAFHPGGVDRTAMPPVGFALVTANVYEARPTGPPPVFAAAMAMGPVVLVHSARAGDRLAALVARRDAVALAAISETAARAAGPGWETVAVADAPTDAALVALAAMLVRGGRACNEA